MPSVHAQTMAAFGRPALHHGHGEEVVYVVPAYGDQAESRTALTMDLGPEEQVEVVMDAGRSWVTERNGIVSFGMPDANYGLIAATGIKHTVEIGVGQAMRTWTVDRVPQKSGSGAVLRLRLSKRLHNERPGLVARP